MIEPEEITFGVITCLYNGIWKKIEFAELVSDRPELFNKAIQEATEALEFYKKHCVVSTSSLEEYLKAVIGEKGPAESAS